MKIIQIQFGCRIIRVMAVLLALLFSGLSTSLNAQTNLLSNGDFEAGTSGWTVWGATLSLSNDAHSGNNAALISNRKNSWDAIVVDLSTSLVNGETYKLGAWIKSVGPAVNLRATLKLTVDGSSTYNSYMWTSSPKIGSYEYYSDEIYVRWSGTLTGANLYFETDKSGETFSDYLIDDVVLEGIGSEADTVVVTKGLKDISSTMLIGGCISDGNKNFFNNNKVKSQVLSNCNTVTIQCYPAWGRWDETEHHVYHVDEFSAQVREAKNYHLPVTAHMLLGWNQYFPDWFKRNNLPADTIDAILHSWIKTIIQYKGNDTLVDSWNVVNEAISWNGKGSYWDDNSTDKNKSCDLQKLGYEPDASGLTGIQKVNAQHPVYIRKGFEYARMYTNKKLELRDASIEFPGDSKYHAFYQLVVHLLNMGTPLDVIGFQTHLNLEQNYDWDGFINNIKRYRALGLMVNVNEVDVGDNEKDWNAEKAQYQKQVYYRVVESAIKGGASELHTWGFYDNNNTGWRFDEMAFPFGKDMEPKPAYYGIQEALTDMSAILYWDMDEPEEDTLPDVSNNGNNGSMINFTSENTVNGFKKKALLFDGIDDFIRSSLAEKIDHDFTLVFYLKTTSETEAVLASLNSKNKAEFAIQMLSNGTIDIVAENGTIPTRLSSTIPVNNDEWHFIAFQKDSNEYRLMVDQTLTKSQGNESIVKIEKLEVGGSSAGSQNFSGAIDDLRLYATAIEENSFQRNMLPFAPMKLVASVSKMVVNLSWSDQSNNENGFVLERKTKDTEWHEVARVEGKSNARDTVNSYETTYTYRVRAFNQFGTSNPSISVSILTPEDPKTSVGFLFGKPDNDRIKIYPNPVQTELTIVDAKNCQIELFDNSGRLMQSKAIETNLDRLDFSNLSAGLYFLKMYAPGAIMIRKLIRK